MKDKSGLWTAVAGGLLVGTASGMRSQMGLAVVLNAPGRTTLPAFWRRPALRWGTELAAAGELVADKVPSVPSRLEPGPFGARVVLGGLAAGLLADSRRRPVVPAVVAAMVAAAAATKLAHDARAAAARHLPDPLVALVEDAAATALAVGATRL